MIQKCMTQPNYNSTQHYPRCSKHTIQKECKSARCKQIIAIETIQEMYATVPTHFPICDQLYHMIMQTKECEKESAPAPPAPPTPQVPPPLPAHGPVHVLVHVLGTGPGPSLTQPFSYPHAAQLLKAMFSKFQDTHSRMETTQMDTYCKYI